jgi:hypothetical protein
VAQQKVVAPPAPPPPPSAALLAELSDTMDDSPLPSTSTPSRSNANGSGSMDGSSSNSVPTVSAGHVRRGRRDRHDSSTTGMVFDGSANLHSLLCEEIKNEAANVQAAAALADAAATNSNTSTTSAASSSSSSSTTTTTTTTAPSLSSESEANEEKEVAMCNVDACGRPAGYNNHSYRVQIGDISLITLPWGWWVGIAHLVFDSRVTVQFTSGTFSQFHLMQRIPTPITLQK